MSQLSTESIVTIGASHAASQLLPALRQRGWTGRLTLVSDEPHLPYHRPPLSKAFMSGEQAINDILIRPAQAYEDMGVELHLDRRAERIDRAARQVHLSDGTVLPYTKLVLATGARARRLDITGGHLDDIFYLRNQADALAMADRVARSRRAVVIGGGYIGLEVAASLRKSGLEVTVLEAMDRILQRVTVPEMSDFYRRIHAEEGVVIRESVMAKAIVETEDGLSVETPAGSFSADLVVVGIGVIPNVELAEDAGLEIGDPALRESGIRVDAFGRTSDPDIYAIGDVAWHRNPIYDRYVRLESVPNATEMAKTAALHIVSPQSAKPYSALPWFWSDQYDLKLQIAGLGEGATNYVLRRDPSQPRQMALFHFADDRLLAVDAVNDPRSFMFAKMVIPKGATLDKIGLSDPATPLKSCVSS